MLLLLLSPVAVRGQDSEGSEPEVAQQQLRPSEGHHPIPEEEVQSRGELVSADLRRLEELLKDRPVVSRIGDASSSREAEIVATARPSSIESTRVGSRYARSKTTETPLAEAAGRAGRLGIRGTEEVRVNCRSSGSVWATRSLGGKPQLQRSKPPKPAPS